MEPGNKLIRLPFSKRRVPLRYIVIHSLYWILITGFFLYEKRYLIYKASMPFFLACVSVRILLLIAIAYLNLHYFLPQYLLKKRYRQYFTAIILSVIVYLITQSLFDYYLYGYVIGPMRNSDLWEALSYNFFSTMWYLAIVLALKLSIDWYSQQLTIQHIMVEKLNAEVHFLRAQINPHFLFNALNNLYGLTLKKSDAAPEVVLMLSNLMEYMLHESDQEYIPLEKELHYLYSYIDLERIRSENQADIQIEVNGKTDSCFIPPFLILPLLENAFKHGLNLAKSAAFLHLKIDITAELKVQLSNSKPLSTASKHRSGLGLLNLKKRLALLYPDRHELHIDDLPGKYEVTLKIVL